VKTRGKAGHFPWPGAISMRDDGSLTPRKRGQSRLASLAWYSPRFRYRAPYERALSLRSKNLPSHLAWLARPVFRLPISPVPRRVLR
jgi:hypothetical protein